MAAEGHGGGISGFGIAEEEQKPLGGTGGAAGAGTRAGEGEVSGEGIGLGQDPAHREGAADEAEALGTSDDHDKTPALEYGEGDRPRGPTIGEAIGSGAGEDVGRGTASDHSGLGGGKPPVEPVAEQ